MTDAPVCTTNPQLFDGPADYESRDAYEGRMAAARPHCLRCPQIESCLEDALQHRAWDIPGMVGGHTTEERVKLATQTTIRVLPTHRASTSAMKLRKEERRQMVRALDQENTDVASIANLLGVSISTVNHDLAATA